MTKKVYMQPTTNVVKIQHSKMLCVSLRTSGLGGDDLGYDKKGGNQRDAWVKGNGCVNWDDDWSE